MITPITATFPALNFPKEVDYPTQNDWAAFSAAAELNYGILSGEWSDKSEEFKEQTNNLALEIQTIGENAINAISLDTIEDLATYTGTGLVMVKDINRGGTFVSKTAVEIDPNTGSLYVENGGTVFSKLGGGFWVRQYSGIIFPEWFNITNKKIIDYVSIKSNVHILTYGDSITWGKKPDGTQSVNRYPITLLNMLENAFNYSGVTVTEKGFPGRQTDTALANFNTDVVAFNPDFVLIMFGINDSRSYDGGTYDVVPVEEYKKNLKNMCLKSFQNGIIPILLTPTPTIEKTEQIKLLAYYNACIDLANEIGVEYVDTRKPFDNFLKKSGLNIEELMDDYIHMTRYDWLGNAVFERIINSDVLKFEKQKINAFNQLYISGDNLTFSQIADSRNCVVLNKNGTNGNYIKSTFFIQEPNMNLFINTADGNNTIQSYVVKIDGVDYKMMGKQGIEESSFKDLIISNLSIGIHELEINISSFISLNSNDLLVLFGFEIEKNNILSASILYDNTLSYLSKKYLTYDTIGSGNFFFESQLSTGSGAIEFFVNEKEVYLNDNFNLLTILTDFKFSTSNSGLSFLCTDAIGGYTVYFTGSNVVLMKRVSKVIAAASYVVLATAPFSYTAGTTYSIKITYSNLGECNIYINSALVLTKTGLNLMSGFFGATMATTTSLKTCEISNLKYCLNNV